MMWVVADEDIGRKGDLPLMHTRVGRGLHVSCIVRSGLQLWMLIWRRLLARVGPYCGVALCFLCATFRHAKHIISFLHFFQASRVHLECMSPDLGTM